MRLRGLCFREESRSLRSRRTAHSGRLSQLELPQTGSLHIANVHNERQKKCQQGLPGQLVNGRRNTPWVAGSELL